jgi:hypothetical protein
MHIGPAGSCELATIAQYLLWGLTLFKIGVDSPNPVSAGGSHNWHSQSTRSILPAVLCEILLLRKPGRGLRSKCEPPLTTISSAVSSDKYNML